MALRRAGAIKTLPLISKARSLRSLSQPRAAIPASELPSLLKSRRLQRQLPDELALKLLALTFLRAQELTGATWDEVNFEKKLWTIPERADREPVRSPVPLSAEALAIFKALRQLSDGGP